jgi:lipopolysaccharide heptosyltransferase I
VPEPALAPPPRRVLVIRLSAIGDVILSSAVIPVLSAAWPQARIDWLTQDVNADLLSANPRLDRVHVLPRRRWASWLKEHRYLKVLGEFGALAGVLRRRRYDLVLDLQGLLKSGVWAWLSGGHTRIGLGSREGSGLLMTRVVSRRVESLQPGKEYRALCAALGLDTAPFAMDVVVSGPEAAAAAELLAGMGVKGPYAVFAPFTTRPQKHWFDERWIELARRLREVTGLPVLMLGGPGDRDHARAIAGYLEGGIVDLTGRTSLQACAAVIRGAHLLVGVDTGLSHLGLAMGTPTLALFGSTRPYLDPGVSRGRVLYEALECSPCRRHPTCNGEFTCMRLHTVDKVMEAVRPWLRDLM